MDNETVCPDCGGPLREIERDAPDGNLDLLLDGTQRWRCEGCEVMWRDTGDGLERA
jgi:uncharacterized protein with PIN domain